MYSKREYFDHVPHGLDYVQLRANTSSHHPHIKSMYLGGNRRHLNPDYLNREVKKGKFGFPRWPQDLTSLADLPPKWNQHLVNYFFGGREAAPKGYLR